MIVRTITVPSKEDRLMVKRFLGVKARQRKMVERQERLIRFVQERQLVPLKEAAEKFSVAVRTLRRDVSQMAGVSISNGMIRAEASHE